ncbi:hypothetical protein LINPERPRIM_LOCUS10979 [Linum perenne]
MSESASERKRGVRSVRESVSERKRGVGSVSLGGWGFSAGFSTRKDQSLRTLRIRGREISFSLSDRFADAAFRISVTGVGVSHFIFLDITLLQWIRDVLQEALQREWKLGKVKSLVSGSRSLSVGSFSINDVNFLRLEERCKNGKRFYVAIPMDEDHIGWSAFLKSVLSILADESTDITTAGRDPLISFASVVKGSAANRVEVGNAYQPRSTLRIQAEDEGVSERIHRLKSWVVIKAGPNLVGDEAWLNFRKWMKRWWDWEDSGEIILLGDDSWLVECRSEQAVNDILRRRKWFFQGCALELRRWHPDAGRDPSWRRKGGLWILAFGIPVHLRANSTFKAVGEACGGYLDCQETSFSAVRILVKTGSEIPSSISLCHNRSAFEVTILVEPSIGSAAQKGKGVPAASPPRKKSGEPLKLKKQPPAPSHGAERGECSAKGEARVGDLGFPMNSGIGPDKSGLVEEELINEVGSKSLGPTGEVGFDLRRLAALDLVFNADLLGPSDQGQLVGHFSTYGKACPISSPLQVFSAKQNEASLLPLFLAAGREFDSMIEPSGDRPDLEEVLEEESDEDDSSVSENPEENGNQVERYG